MSGACDCMEYDAEGQISVREALDRLREAAAPMVQAETVPLAEAAYRVLAEPLVAPRDVPAFDNVAVDGYAFAAAGLAENRETRLPLVEGRAAAGHPFPERVPPGTAVRVLTGAVLPAGTDTVAMEEEVRIENGRVVIPAGYRAGANARKRGEDVAAGGVLFGPGTRLLPQHLGVAASLGRGELTVFAPLRVAVFSSGDELREPGQPFAEGTVYDANRQILKALLAPLPVRVTDLGILADREEVVREALAAAAERFDVVVTSGGASRGDEDHMVRTVEALGRLHFWRVRMKPGRPIAFGRIGRAFFVGLPGNPVAAAVCFLLFARPLLLRLGGASWREPPRFPVPAAFSMRKKTGRTEFLRAMLVRREDGSLAARRIARQGSGILTGMTEADGIVTLEEPLAEVREGDPVPFTSFAEFGYPA